jgi:small-conductance mechanosensitive channel
VTLLVLVGAYLLTGVIKRFVFDVTRDRTAITQHQTELVFRTTQLGVYVLAGVIVLGLWRVDLGGLLVGAGFLGIVVGLAARQTLGSLIAGFVLMFARPFEIGDWVQIGDREGIVTEISIVNTRIQTFDGEYAMIPNDTVGSSEVVNRTRKGRLRIQVDVGVDYAADVEDAMEVAVEAMREVDDVLAVPQPRAVLKEFGSSSIVVNLRFWIDKPSARRKWRAQTAVIAAVKSAFDREGISIPFPQRVVSNRAAGADAGFHVDAEAPSAEASPDGDGNPGAEGSAPDG